MKKIIAFVAALLISAPANASYNAVSSPFIISSPDTAASFSLLYCEEGLTLIDASANKWFQESNCMGSPPTLTQIFPIQPTQMDIAAFMQTLMGSPNIGSLKSSMFTGSSSQCILGDGTTGVCPTPSHTHPASDIVSGTKTSAFISDFTEATQDAVGSETSSEFVYNDGANTLGLRAKSFNYTTRSLNTCFQPSSTRDALVTYGIDIATVSTLLSGQVGTVYLELFTDSGCTMGTQEITHFVNGNTQSLGLTVTMNQSVTAILSGVVPAGSYVKIRTQNNTGTPTFTARPGQETLL